MIKLKIRHATQNDSSIYLDWRNDPKVRASAFTTEKISKDIHEQWYLNKLKNDSSVLFIINDESNSVGQVRFEISEGDSSAEINYSIAKEYRGKGIATPLMSKAIDAFLKQSTNTVKLIAKVKIENAASNKVFENLHFKKIEQSEQSMNIFELLS